MKKYFNINCLLALAAIVVMGACSEDEQAIPEGKGVVEIRLTAPYQRATRADGDWLDPVYEAPTVELIHEYWVAFVDEGGIVEELVHSDALGAEEYTFRFFLPAGNYTAYAFANLPSEGTTFASLGIVKGQSMPNLTSRMLSTTNGWTENIPMSSHIGGQAVTVAERENQSFEIELIRTMAKLELTFINNSQQEMKVVGYEVYPLTTTGVSLFELDNPSTIDTSDSTSYKMEFASPLILAGKSTEEGAEPATQTTYIYVNETNATATATKNQYSIRIRVQRTRVDQATSDETTVEEMRYGFTVNSQTSGNAWKTGVTNGFDYIRRNDWIKLPIMFTDWTFRIEALPFPPIAGFQSRVLSADALSITFNSGGYIFLRPMFRNNTDPEGVWRGFDDGDVTFRLRGEPYTVNGSVAESIDTDTGTGIVMTGDLDIFKQRFVQLPSGDIVGELVNDDSKIGLVTVTIKLKLDGFAYQFNYNIIKQ